MHKKNKILVISQFYAPEPIGSPPVITDICENIAKENWDVNVITTRPSYPIGSIFNGYENGEKDNEKINNVTIKRLKAIPTKNGGIFARLISEFFFGVMLLKEAFTKHTKYDYVISLCPSMFVPFLANFFYSKKGCHITIIHDIPSELGVNLKFKGASFLSGIIKFVERVSFNKADKIITLSEGMKKELKKNKIKKPIIILPPHINTYKIFPLPDKEKDTLLYSGNFGRKQGLYQILDLAKILKITMPGVRIILRGKGNQENIIKEQAKELDNVFFKDLEKIEKLNESLSEGTIHLVPQIPEGANSAVPSKLYLIMASGRTAICTANEGSPLDNLAKETNAFAVVPPNAPKEFAQSVQELINNKEQRQQMGKNGREYVEKYASHTFITKKILELLKNE